MYKRLFPVTLWVQDDGHVMLVTPVNVFVVTLAFKLSFEDQSNIYKIP